MSFVHCILNSSSFIYHLISFYNILLSILLLVSTFPSPNRPQRFPWAEWGILFEYPVDTNPVAPDRQPVALRAGPFFRFPFVSFTHLHVLMLICSDEENVFKENGKCIPQESENSYKFKKQFTWNEIICEELFCPMLGFSEFEASQHPSKMLQRQHKALQYVAINHLFVSTLQWNALHIQQSSFIHHIINLHPPEYPKCHRHSIWVLCSSPTKMSKHWDHGNDGWERYHFHHFGSCNFLVLKLLNDPKSLSLIICPL